MVQRLLRGMYSVLYDFVGLEKGEVSVHAGQLVEVRDNVIGVNHEGWSLVKFEQDTTGINASSVEGYVPTNYLVRYSSGEEVDNDGYTVTCADMKEGNFGPKKVCDTRRKCSDYIEFLGNDATLSAGNSGFLLRGFLTNASVLRMF